MAINIVVPLSKKQTKILRDYVAKNKIKNNYGVLLSQTQACYSIIASFCEEAEKNGLRPIDS